MKNEVDENEGEEEGNKKSNVWASSNFNLHKNIERLNYFADLFLLKLSAMLSSSKPFLSLCPLHHYNNFYSSYLLSSLVCVIMTHLACLKKEKLWDPFFLALQTFCVCFISLNEKTLFL